MSINLGIELGEDRMSAAYERATALRMVSFAGARHAVLRVHVGRDGVIRSGEDAVVATATDPAGLVTGLAARLGDAKSMIVNGYAVTAEMLFAHVLAFVIARAETQADGDQVANAVLVLPTSWTPAMRAAIVAAAAQAGLSDVVTVAPERAVERAPDNARHLPEQAAALGAAVLAATRGRSSPGASSAARAARPARPAAPLATSAPTSVFDATDPSASHLAGAGGAGGGSGGRGVGGAGGGDLSGEGGDRPNRLPFVLVGGALVAALVVLVVLLVTRGNGSSSVSAGSVIGASTTASTSTSSTTSSSTTSSTTSTSTSTTVKATTSTSATKPTATSSTTTTIVPPAHIGPVALADNGLILQFGASSSSTLRFGDDADITLARLIVLAGDPRTDSGWKQVALCTGDETRRMSFGDLEVVFTKNAAGSPTGSRTFQQWFVDSPGKTPDGLVTLDRIGIGSTVADLRKLYGSALKVVNPIPGDPSGLFTTSEGGTFIDGITTGSSDRSWIRQMWAGTACQRVAD